MERENSEYKLRGVSATQLKVLVAAGGYEVKQACLTRTMSDGRLEIVMVRSEIERLEELEREVDAECNEVTEALGPLEMPESVGITPPLPAQPEPNIPQADKDAYKRMFPDQIPERPESSRPRDGGSSIGPGRLDIGAIFNR
jgi:hypothetical protein